MILILECIVICFILFLPCVVVIANGIHNGAFLFEKDVQERVIQMGLITISRYRNYIPNLSEDIKRDIYARMQELIDEEKKYCDQENYKHMAQIFTSIALYQTLQKHGKSEERI